MNIGVLAPHCDDAEFGIGGSIARWLEEGHRVDVRVMSVGDYTRSDGKLVRAEDRISEAVDAFVALGGPVHSIVRVFPENRALSTPYEKIVGEVEKFVSSSKFDALYVALPSFNQDHRVLYDATITALRPSSAHGQLSLYGYEYPGSCWGFDPPSVGRKYMGLTAIQMDKKMAALRCHVSQFDKRSMNHVSPSGAEALAILRGSEIGIRYAEMVYVIREVLL